MQPLIECQPVGDSYIFANDRYTVMVRMVRSADDAPEWIMLSIKRNDREPIMDWRDMQWLKNQLLGQQIEAVQLFPAESRLVDTANQYWLFASVDPDFRFPFGFSQRLVSESITVKLPGHGASVQRPFAEHVRPDDLEAMETQARTMFANHVKNSLRD